MTELDLADVQGNILRSYGRHFCFVRHLVLRVGEASRARAALADMVTGDRSTPEVTRADRAPRDAEFSWCLNVGITYRGLAALGVPAAMLRTFPAEFREGMVSRASWLGDVGASAPEHWIGGLGDPEHVHLVVTVHGRTANAVEGISDAVLGAQGARAFVAAPGKPLDGAYFPEPDQGRVHFGFQDGLSNVRFEGIHEASDPSQGALAPLGTVLLGYPSPIPHVTWGVPQDPLGGNGSFNAFRVLRQDVRGFEAFLKRAADQAGCDPEEVAAKICGRWRNGAPLTLAPTAAEAAALPDPLTNEFGFADDPDGARCPIGSHIRRCNPRDARIVQRGTNDTRALVRRGMPYGPPFDPATEGSGDEVPRGLLGSFICASLGAQFESLQFGWLNFGLQDPSITGTNDPLVGANDEGTASLTWQTSAGKRPVVDGLPRFVTTEGGAYCFLPSLTAIGWIASAGWDHGDVPSRRRFAAQGRAGP